MERRSDSSDSGPGAVSGAKRRTLVLINPTSGRGRCDRAREIERQVRSQGLEATVEVTRRPGHARELLRRRGAEFSVVMVVGGDGTLHEIVQELDLDRHHVGVIPWGSGNDWAWMNDWPGDLSACLARVTRGNSRRVDLGLANGIRFHNSLGIGFEATVNRESQRIRRLRGPALYIAAALRCLARRPSYRVHLTWDDGEIRGEILQLTVAIGRRVGGAFVLTPEARNDDGAFDLCVVTRVSFLRALTLLPKTFSGKHTKSSAVTMLRTRKLEVEAPDGIPVHIDGEFLGPEVKALAVKSLPGALQTF